MKKIRNFGTIETVEESETAFRERLAARETDIRSRGAATDGTGGIVEAGTPGCAA